jgi:hypothetical protein
VIPGFDDTLKNARPPVPPAIGGGSATELGFPGISKPTSDLQAVRDGRRSTLLGYLVDLSIARSFAAGSALLLPIAGNVFMSDPLFDLTGVSQSGIARVHFQDENFNPVGTYVTALPSAIYKVPFTQVAIENYAQAGKFLYIVYGVDVDLVPGASQQVQATILNLAQQLIGGVQELVVMERGFTYGGSYISVTNLVANTSVAVVAAASNLNGMILWRASWWSHNAVGPPNIALAANPTAPNSTTVGEPLATNDSISQQAALFESLLKLERPVFIAAGKGLWLTSNITETQSQKGILYTLL